MFCNKCGRQVAEGQRYCSDCAGALHVDQTGAMSDPDRALLRKARAEAVDVREKVLGAISLLSNSPGIPSVEEMLYLKRLYSKLLWLDVESQHSLDVLEWEASYCGGHAVFSALGAELGSLRSAILNLITVKRDVKRTG
jgi:hypothetical protein